MDLGLKGLKAIVTGGTRGIGRAIADTLAAEGCDVGICARNEEEVKAAVAELKKTGCNATGAAVDVADGDALKEWITSAADELGGLDILVSNVSAFGSSPSEDSWKASFDVDIMETVRAIEAATPKLLESEHAAIVVTGSASAIEARAIEPYGAAKAALLHVVGGVSQQLAKQGVRANTVTPGPVFFEGGVWDRLQKQAPQYYDGMLAKCPTGRMSTPQEIANAAVFLASPAASHITGTNLIVDGGLLTRVQF